MLPRLGYPHALAWFVGFGRAVVSAEVERIYEKRISHGLHLTPVRDAGATHSQSNFLRHSRPLPATQLGVRGNGIWLGELCPEASDHEWELRRLWKEGVNTKPSEVFRRQIYVDFWYEKAGIELRELIGVDNIMWESDYPHIASTYPRSWSYVEKSLAGVPQHERQKMCYENALRLYGVT